MLTFTWCVFCICLLTVFQTNTKWQKLKSVKSYYIKSYYRLWQQQITSWVIGSKLIPRQLARKTRQQGDKKSQKDKIQKDKKTTRQKGKEDEAARWKKITYLCFFFFSFSSFPFFFLLLFWGKWRGRSRKVKKITFLCFFLLLFEVKVTDGDRLSLEEDWI